jgi:uncharacterized protein YbjT (DUF2867 family)
VPEPVLVLGATGTTGSRVVETLTRQGVSVRAATRTPTVENQVRFDWAAPETWAAALRGTAAVYLIAPIGVADPVPLLEPFLRESARQGVRRVVLLSSSAVPEGAPGLGAAHRLVRELAPEWTVLRPSWFMQNFTGTHPHAQGVEAGELVTATGRGRVGFIDAADIAVVAAHALTAEVSLDTELLLTGPEALGYSDVAAILAEVTGRPMRHRSVAVDEFAARLTELGYPADFSAMLAALDGDIRRGAQDQLTSTVTDLTGWPARSFRDFARKQWTTAR